MSKKSEQRNAAARATGWIGSTASIAAHTALFAAFFAAGLLGAEWNTVLLVLTTVVSLEAIYLAIFIQMTVNQNTESLEEVESDIDDIQEDVEELSEDVGEIQEDVDEIQEDIDEIQDDVEDLSEEEKNDEPSDAKAEATLESIQDALRKLAEDIERLKGKER